MRVNIFQSTRKYLQEAVHELRQVQWPTRNHAVRISIIAAVFVVSSAAFLALIDSVLNRLLLLSK